MQDQSDQAFRNQCVLVAKCCLSANLRRTTRAITQFYAKIMEPSGLEPTQFTLLIACVVVGPAPITVLADALVMDRTTLTRNVKLLAKQGLVQIKEGDDHRVRVVELSKRGRTAIEKALPLWEDAQARLLEGLGKERSDNLLKDLYAAVKFARL